MISDYDEFYETFLTHLDEIAKDLPQKFEKEDGRWYNKELELTCKIPYRIAGAVESLAHRIYDLSVVSKDLIDNNKIIPSIIFARAIMESTALVFHIYRKSYAAVKNGNLNELDEFVIKCLTGNRSEKKDPDSPNILTAIDHLNRESGWEQFRDFYDALSEFTHPNSMGTFYAYAKFNSEDFSVEFGENKGKTNSIAPIGSICFSLEVFRYYYTRFDELLYKIKHLSTIDYLNQNSH